MTSVELLGRSGQFLPVAVGVLLVGAATRTCAGEVELLRDPHFRHGFTVSAPAPGQHVLAGVFRPEEDGPAPIWRICQWSSRFPLVDFAARPTEDGSVALANEAKSVRIARPGRPGADLTLAVSGSLEYGHKARKPGEPWVHLLVDQELQREAWLPDLKALWLHLDARVTQCDRDLSADYAPSVHAAQVPLFISVQNRNPSSPGLGDYYHFGIAIFDNREARPAAFVAGDPGTGKLMYCPNVTSWTPASTHDGGWVTFEGDLLPEMLKGLEACWERGFLDDSRDLRDYRPAGICIGWEVAGVFDVAVQLRHLSLRATMR